MFDKILIANRGEIACRVMRTARRLGVRSVAVYSQADAGARHVRLADEAILIGAAAARDSYLVGERIIAAALASGAQAVHPGYGFLSENEDFAAACAAAGLVFIGPPIAAIRDMGSKSAAKTLMGAAGVPLVPGSHGDLQGEAFLQDQADQIGYPLLLKPSAGGGGKGMRVVKHSGEFAAALASCKREALSSFGDEHVLLERYLERPRHVEVQVFGDSQGHIVHLFERDCSVQRRHQKVLEEAPAPGMSPERRTAMGKAAVEAARAVGYVGAGTVEFIAEADFVSSGHFYFMEMNTRLQVEHPVTEMITGVDLVEWQLRIAAGEPLPLLQEQLQIRGHALEARIYAEDPVKGFLPSTGRLLHLAPPEESLHVRIDTGIEQGDEITPYYDPMISKLIVWDENRDKALARMLAALAHYRVVGVANNIDFLSRLVTCPSFASGDVDTGLIEREQAQLFPEATTPPTQAWLVAALAELLREAQDAQHAAAHNVDPYSPWHQRDGWRVNSAAQRSLRLRYGEVEEAIAVAYEADAYRLTWRGQVTRVAGQLGTGGSGQLRADLDGMRLTATVIAAAERRHVFLHGRAYVFASIDPLYHAGAGGGTAGGLTAPMPGKVIALLAEAGQRVEAGAPLLILEAMKMEHTITAPAAGLLKSYHFGVGEQVADGDELVDFDAAALPKEGL